MRKHLLYLTNTLLTARFWQGGQFSTERVFENNDLGRAEFVNYVAEHQRVQILLLVDLIEEDFHRDTIPHVVGKARRALIERRLVQLYRDTPFRHASFQGREKQGRRDDRMLFSALTNASLVKPWIDIILKAQVPIAGMFSTSLLSAVLFEKLQLGTDPVLFITHQSAGLRQSYFHDGFLKFSRLTQLAAQEPEAVAELSNAEIAKTRQFLANTRLLQRSESLKIVIVDDGDILQRLNALNVDSAAATFRFIDVDEAANSSGFRHLQGQATADVLLLALLCKKPPESHYALFEQSRAYLMWQWRIVLYLLSGATVLASLFWAGANAFEALDASLQLNQLRQNTQMNEKHYQRVVQSMPQTVANPHDMKSAVDLEQLISNNAPTPNALLVTISQALDAVPQLSLKELSWEVSDKTPAEFNISDAAPPPPADTPPLAALIGVPTKPTEIVILKGEILPFQGDNRAALDSVNRFSTILMKNENITVSVTRPPFDVRSSASVTGEIGNLDNAPTADFELRLVWKH